MLPLIITAILSATLQANTQDWVSVSLSDKRSGWIRSSVLIYDLHFSSRAILKESIKKNNMILNRGTEVVILGSKGGNFKCQHPKGITWIEGRYLNPSDRDLGYIVTTKKTDLKNRSFNKAGKLAAGLKIKAIRFVDNFVQIEWDDKKYFVEIDSILSKFNFASMVKTDIWHDVKSVLQHRIVTTRDKIINMEDVRGIITNRSYGYIATTRANVRKGKDLKSKVLTSLPGFLPIPINGLYSKDSSLPARGKVAMNKKVISKPKLLKKGKDNIPAPDLYFNKKSWTSDELFNRTIFDIATSSRVKNLMFASAGGVFKSTTGGKLWEKIEVFENNNLPIAVSKNGTVYIGQYKSVDNGVSFVPYIKWDLALKAIQYQGVSNVGLLSINNISFLNDEENTFKLDLQLENNKKASIITHDGGSSWLPVID